MFKTPILMLKMKFFWLIFRGKFEQKTQNSIFLKNQWRLKNIKKAMVVKNIIAEDMAFTKSIFEQFWRSYCKKTIFVVFHFLKFLPLCQIRVCHVYVMCGIQNAFSSVKWYSIVFLILVLVRLSLTSSSATEPLLWSFMRCR